MGESNDVRKNIKQTFEQLTDTVDALSAKSDVATRVKDTLTQTTGNVGARFADGATAIRSGVDAVSSAVPDAETVRARVMNPYALSLGLLAAGVLAGLLIPLSSLERRRLKPIGDDLAERAVQARDEIIDQSKMVVRETISAAQDSAQKHGKELAGHLGGSAPAAHGPSGSTASGASID